MSKTHTLLNLDKPIIFFDLETTGVKSNVDRIIEFSAVKIYPAGKEDFKTLRLNPEMPKDVQELYYNSLKQLPKYQPYLEDLKKILEIN